MNSYQYECEADYPLIRGIVK